jgi:hypothetical protein
MATKAEIDEMVEKCEVCAETDSRSFEEHFEDCKICAEYAETLERMNKQMSFLEELASKPLENRKQLLGARMRKFLGMEPEERNTAISDLLDGLADLSEEARFRVVKARTDLIMEIPRENRQTIMSVFKEIMSGWSPERKMIERMAVMKATEDYSFLKKKMVRKKFGSLLA